MVYNYRTPCDQKQFPGLFIIDVRIASVHSECTEVWTATVVSIICDSWFKILAVTYHFQDDIYADVDFT